MPMQCSCRVSIAAAGSLDRNGAADVGDVCSFRIVGIDGCAVERVGHVFERMGIEARLVGDLARINGTCSVLEMSLVMSRQNDFKLDDIAFRIRALDDILEDTSHCVRRRIVVAVLNSATNAIRTVGVSSDAVQTVRTTLGLRIARGTAPPFFIHGSVVIT